MMTDAEDILNYWFYEVGPDRWFKDDPALNADLCERFSQAYEKAAENNLSQWEETPEGALALILLLTVFPRRMFKGTSKAFETDDIALDLARQAIIRHFDDRIDKSYKLLFYLPFVYSESAGDQRLGGFYLRERTKEPDWVDRGEKCTETIERFGRFPQRNKALERETTDEETAYLSSEHGRGEPFEGQQ